MPFRSTLDILGHEHIHVLQKQNHPANNSFDMLDDTVKHMFLANMTPVGKGINKVDNIVTFGTSRYLINDCEVQARLHTIMVHGSKRWGSLPKNRHQLWAALHDSGLSMPSSIREEFDREEFNNAIKNDFSNASRFWKPELSDKFFRCIRKVFNPEVTELQSAQRSLYNESLRETFWRFSLPLYYGHLLALYGDRHGLDRMKMPKQREDIFLKLYMNLSQP